MSRALTRAREHLEATPRSVDSEQMVRIVRGDRGCLGDLLSGLGALTLVVLLVLAGIGQLAFSWVYLGVALFVGGFFLGTVTQARSGKRRRAALEAGPLVLGVVLRSEDWLRRPGKRAGRAVVLFCLDESRRFDRPWLEQAATTLEEQLGKRGGDDGWVPVRTLLADPESFALTPIPPALLPDDASQVYLAAVIVHPERLEAGYLGGDDDDEAGERGEALDGPTRPPTILAIVEAEQGFIEQAPRI